MRESKGLFQQLPNILDLIGMLKRKIDRNLETT